MARFILQKATLQCWRLFQILLVTAIFSLEFAQIQGFGKWYHEEPSHGGASYYWLVIFLTYLTLLYLLTSFSYRWITGPHKNETYIDIFLAHLWLIISLMNIATELNGGTLTCDYPDDENKYARTTRCRLFLSSMSLGWIVAATYVVSSYISIMRWRNRPIEAKSSKFVEPSIVVHKPETYLVQKGVLADGQPALFFHKKNKSSSNLSTRGGGSGDVTPTSSHNDSTNNLGFTQQSPAANSSKTSIYLHDKDVTDT